MRRARPEALENAVDRMLLLAEVSRLHRVDIRLAAPQREPESLADRVAGALVVGVAVGERVRGDPPSGDLAHDPAPRVTRGRVHQHVAHQVDVDGAGRKSPQQVQVGSKLSHLGGSYAVAWGRG